MTRNLALLLVLAAGAASGGNAFAADPNMPIKIADAWAREASGGVSAIYLSVVNSQPHSDALLSVASPAAKRAEVHETSVVDGIAHMRPIPNLEIPANSTVSLSPAGKHIMLMELVAPLRRGSTLALTLSFARAGQARVVVPVFTSRQVETNVRQQAMMHVER